MAPWGPGRRAAAAGVRGARRGHGADADLAMRPWGAPGPGPRHAMCGKFFSNESVSVVVRDSQFALDSILNLQLPLSDSLEANERTHNIPTLFVSSPSIRIEQACAGRLGLDISDDLLYACTFPQTESGSWLTPIPTPCLIPGFVMVCTSVSGTFSFEQLEGSKVTRMTTVDGFKKFVLSHLTVGGCSRWPLRDS